MKSITAELQELLEAAGLGFTASEYLRLTATLSLWVASLVTLLTLNLVNPLFTFPWTLGVVVLCCYLVLLFSASAKARDIESSLHDGLLLVSSNLRAGFDPARALILASRSELGCLADELRRSGEEAMRLKTLQQALLDSTKRVRSSLYSKVVRSIVDGLEAGGSLVDLLEEAARSLEEERFQKARVQARLMTRLIPFAFFLCVILPVSFAAVETTSGSPPGFFLASLGLTSFLGSLLLGIQRLRQVLSYFPLVLLIALSFYFVTKALVE